MDDHEMKSCRKCGDLYDVADIVGFTVHQQGHCVAKKLADVNAEYAVFRKRAQSQLQEAQDRADKAERESNRLWNDRERLREALQSCQDSAHNDWRVREIVDAALNDDSSSSQTSKEPK